MRFISFLLFTSIFISCDQKSNLKKILNEGQLKSQFFNVNITRDTTLMTHDGCIIKIPKGSIESDSDYVKLDIKEALTATEIVLAGLTTESNRQALSSGGMIYFNAANGYKIAIKKSLEILVPSNGYNPDMKVYKGEKDIDDKINWKDPQSLPKDSTFEKMDFGERLFKSNCSDCHKIYDDFTGPALYGVTEKRSLEWLRTFTRHKFSVGIDTTPDSPVQNIQNTDTTRPQIYFHDFMVDPDMLYYHKCLQQKYGSEMLPFPSLSDADIDNLYAYIETETFKRPDLKNKFSQTCCDSCEAYHKRVNRLSKEKEDLINENGNFFTLERDIRMPLPVSNTNDNQNYDTAIPPPYSKVTPGNARAVYYTINILAVGWYNIDCLLKNYPACLPGELFVRIQGSYKTDLNVTLIIPSVKAFVEGGKLNDGEQYGFDEDDGKIPLPQNAKAYILAFGEYDNKLIFGKTVFNTQTRQTINVIVEESTKEKMTAEIKALNLDNVNTKIGKSKNADKIIETNKNIKETGKYKPKNCNCDLVSNPSPLKAK